MFGLLSGEKAAFKAAGALLLLLKFDILLFDVPLTFLSLLTVA